MNLKVLFFGILLELKKLLTKQDFVRSRFNNVVWCPECMCHIDSANRLLKLLYLKNGIYPLRGFPKID